jgi:PAS domain-containing protein
MDRALQRAPVRKPARKGSPSPDLDFRDLFESSPALVLVMRPDNTIAAVTDAYLRVSMTSRDEIPGRSIFEVFIAEGVETDAEPDLLHLLSVGLGQGFLLGRPLPLNAATHSRGAKRVPARPAPGSDPVPARLPTRRNGIRPLPV